MFNWLQTRLLDLISSWPPVLHTVAAAQRTLTYSVLGGFQKKGRMLELEASPLAGLGMFLRCFIIEAQYDYPWMYVPRHLVTFSAVIFLEA